MTVVIYHNPNCGTSRNVVALAKAAGLNPDVIEYLNVGWTVPQLKGLFAAANLTPREALRVHKSPAEELGLTKDGTPDDAILAAMAKEPILVNRPIVCSPLGVKLCRPAEAALDILPQWPTGEFKKEDGEFILDANGQRAG